MSPTPHLQDIRYLAVSHQIYLLSRISIIYKHHNTTTNKKCSQFSLSRIQMAHNYIYTNIRSSPIFHNQLFDVFFSENQNSFPGLARVYCTSALSSLCYRKLRSELCMFAQCSYIIKCNISFAELGFI